MTVRLDIKKKFILGSKGTFVANLKKYFKSALGFI